jgi:hypothetical protein
LASARAVGFLRGICESLAGLAVAELRAGEPDRAVACAEEALEAARRIDHFEVATYCLVILGAAAELRDDVGSARSRHVEALELANAAGLSRSGAFALEHLAGIALREGEARAAARLLGAAATLREAPGAAVGLAVAACARLDAVPLLAEARKWLGDDAAAEAFAGGRRDPVSAMASVAATTP